MSRLTYNREWEVPIAWDEDGNLSQKIAYRMQIERGVRVRFCVGFQVLVNSNMVEVVRYDDFRGFHRHAPGAPGSAESLQHIWITNVRAGQEIDYITSDLIANADAYRLAALEGLEANPEETMDSE